MQQDTRLIRRAIRARRRALNPAQQKAAARRLVHKVAASAPFRSARRLALYIAADGEIDPARLCQLAWARGKHVFLPVLHPLHHDCMLFVAYRRGDRLRRNRFGIPEPAQLRTRARVWQLDVIFLPLVAYDDTGNRLGMGGGYYDRTLDRGKAAKWPRKPLLCGLAHRIQRVDALPVNPWDIPLDRVFSD